MDMCFIKLTYSGFIIYIANVESNSLLIAVRH